MCVNVIFKFISYAMVDFSLFVFVYLRIFNFIFFKNMGVEVVFKI